jgi:ribosomal protein S6--L-glutamate ligase
MKIAILSREADSYSTTRLCDVGRARGHDVTVYDTLRFSLSVESGAPQIFYRAEPLEGIHAVIPRIGASVTFYGTAVVRQFEQMGVFTLNPASAISGSRDKLRAMQVLSRHDVGLPATTFVRDQRSVLPAIERLGGAPVVIKLLEGTQGIGVILAESIEVAQAVVETLQWAKQNVLIQRFVAESRGRDVRAIVVAGRVVAAMRRRAKGREFRSNLHRGALAEPVSLSPEYERTAVRATQIMGLRVAGVDMLESESGPQVLEVNSSPGLEGIETATGVDVASAIFQHIEDEVVFPELDVRQRLTLEQGYGVAEVAVPRGSKLEGLTVASSPLVDRDVRILQIQRGRIVLPNPHPDTPLEAGDVLLCYGLLRSMKPFLVRPGHVEVSG